MAWCEPGEPAPKKAKMTHLAPVFLDSKGILLAEYHPCGVNVNHFVYEQTLKKLRDAIRGKRCGMPAENSFAR